MKYLLDSNTCIRYLTRRSPEIFQRLVELPISAIAVCSVVKFELHYGALRSNAIDKNLAEQSEFFTQYRSLPFDDAAQIHASKIRADLARDGTPIGPYDVLIAAIALAHDLILVTHNTKEFKRVEGLKIEDWEAVDTE